MQWLTSEDGGVNTGHLITELMEEGNGVERVEGRSYRMESDTVITLRKITTAMPV